jgi:hypothetical protein
VSSSRVLGGDAEFRKGNEIDEIADSDVSGVLRDVDQSVRDAQPGDQARAVARKLVDG